LIGIRAETIACFDRLTRFWSKRAFFLFFFFGTTHSVVSLVARLTSIVALRIDGLRRAIFPCDHRLVKFVCCLIASLRDDFSFF